MKAILCISDLPNKLNIEELMEVTGGLADNNDICALIGTGVKCTANGSGICTVEGSGIIIPKPDPSPGPDPITGPVKG